MPGLPTQVPWRRFVCVLRKLGYTAQKTKQGSERSFVNPGRPSRTKHASTSVAQVPSQASPLPRRVHATVGTLLDRARKGQLVAIRIRHVEIPLAHLDGSFCGTAECSFNRNLWLRCHSPLPMVVYTVPFTPSAPPG